MALKIAQHWIEMNRLFGFLLSSTIYTHTHTHIYTYTYIKQKSVLKMFNTVTTYITPKKKKKPLLIQRNLFR